MSARLHDWLQRVWYGDAASGFILRPLSWLFAGVLALRRALFRVGVLRTHEPGRPVVIIGNLTVGGTGKTPLTLWLADQLRAAGFRAGIVTRGYGRSGHAPVLLNTSSSVAEAGDEALLLARRSGCPVAVGADRVTAARLVAAQDVDVVLADDGLQHLHLARAVELVVVDGERRFGNARLLPAGPLREPVSRLRSVDAVIVNGGQPQAGELQMQMRASQAVSLRGVSQRPLGSFAGAPVHAVAAIGNPQRFFAMLRSLGLQLLPHALPDHYALQRADITFADGYPVLMTEKDAVKCERFADERHWAVPVTAQFSAGDADRLIRLVLQRCGLRGS